MAHILLIDDDDAVRQSTRLVLEQSGHEVDVLTNGRRAEHVAGKRNIDLVITDLVMPEREGIETIVALRRALPTLPIIAISGGGRFASGTDYLQSAGQLGATFTLSKPIDPARICQMVDEVLK